MLIRILTIREHKTVYFCDVCGKEAHRQQLMIEKNQFPTIRLQTGMVLNCECRDGVSRKGDYIIILEKVNSIYNHTSFSPYKSFQETSKNADSGELQDTYSNILNGGNAIAVEQLKYGILDVIESYLKEHGVHREFTPITTAYRGTSTASPQRAIGQYTGNRYIKITHELGLKIASYLKLQSVYEIGYVCRDRYSTLKNFNEFLTIEGVVLINDCFSLKDFFYDIWQRAVDITKALSIETNPEMEHIKVLDFIEEYGSVPKMSDFEKCQKVYERLMNDNKHMILTNAPINTPFAYAEEDFLPLETKWIYNSKGIGHGYFDEYRIDRVFDAFVKQKEELVKQGVEADLPIDYLSVLEAAGVPTNSFVIGIERLLKDLLMSPSTES